MHYVLTELPSQLVHQTVFKFCADEAARPYLARHANGILNHVDIVKVAFLICSLHAHFFLLWEIFECQMWFFFASVF